MSVLTHDVGRRDILLHRGVDESWACQVKRDLQDGSGVQPLDVSGWQASMTLLDSGGATVYSQDASRLTSDGFVWFDVPSGAFASSEWLARRSGEWRIVAVTGEGSSVLCAWGYWTLA